MKILVTGGAGFIGSNFVKRSLDLRPDLQIVVLDALTYAGDISRLAGHLEKIEFVKGDICDSDLVDSLVAKSDIVVNFAAESHNDNSLQNPKPFIYTNVIGTYELIQASLRHQKRFHQISTDEVFGDLPLNVKEKFTEISPYNPSSPYSASKASSDHLVRSWVRSFGLNATISNCSNNFGPNQHREKLIPRTIEFILNNQKPEIYGNGLNVRDWIHVDDHTDGIWKILEEGVSGETYLLGANNERTNLDVVKAILQALGKDSDFIKFVSDRPGHDRRYAIDASRTKRLLGWQPEEGNFEGQLIQLVRTYL